MSVPDRARFSCPQRLLFSTEHGSARLRVVGLYSDWPLARAASADGLGDGRAAPAWQLTSVAAQLLPSARSLTATNELNLGAAPLLPIRQCRGRCRSARQGRLLCPSPCRSAHPFRGPGRPLCRSGPLARRGQSGPGRRLACHPGRRRGSGGVVFGVVPSPGGAVGGGTVGAPSTGALGRGCVGVGATGLRGLGRRGAGVGRRPFGPSIRRRSSRLMPSGLFGLDGRLRGADR